MREFDHEEWAGNEKSEKAAQKPKASLTQAKKRRKDDEENSNEDEQNRIWVID